MFHLENPSSKFNNRTDKREYVNLGHQYQTSIAEDLKSLLGPLCLKPRSHLAEYFFRLCTIEINSAIANNLKLIGMMKMQCVTLYPNIYECVSNYMKIHHDRFKRNKIAKQQ